MLPRFLGAGRERALPHRPRPIDYRLSPQIAQMRRPHRAPWRRFS